MLKAARIKTWQGKAEILEVLDGDTFKAWVDLGWNIYFRATIRVHSVNTPELPGFEGVQAQIYLRQLLPIGSIVTLSSKRLDLHGRAEADVVMPDGANLRDLIIQTGHGVPANDRGNL
jgi:endonuclease YncB( thermonuclease family)